MPHQMPEHVVKYIDLFCGIGSFHYSFQQLGFKCVMASDIYAPAKDNYKENYNMDILDDICDIDPSTIEDYDILCAGFPCFVAGTNVLTHDGYKNIEDVVMTDTLMTHTGHFKQILNLQHKQYTGSLYDITATAHPSFKCTDEHPFYIREKTQTWNDELRSYDNSFKKPEWKKAHELDNNHYFGMKINENSILPDNDAWFMGYFIGTGMTSPYSHGNKIPEWVQDAPKEYIQAFINGYHGKQTCHEFTTVSPDLAFGLQRLYLKLGRLFNITKEAGQVYHIGEHKMEQSVFIENGYAWYAPFKIEKTQVENEPVYNFEVEHDNSYVIENIISHNCQPFSQAGHHKGFEDTRGTMFSQVMRFVKLNVPKIVILENVQALLNHDGGKSFAKIKTELEDENYKVVFKVLKCSDYGIPQMRKRLFIVGFKNVEVPQADEFFNLKEYEQSTTLTEYLGQNFKKDIAYTLRCGGKHSPIDDRHNWDGYWVDDKEYRLTIEDGLKLQGFHDYNLVGKKNEKWKLLGNTIPTRFTEIIGKQIVKLVAFE